MSQIHASDPCAQPPRVLLPLVALLASLPLAGCGGAQAVARAATTQSVPSSPASTAPAATAAASVAVPGDAATSATAAGCERLAARQLDATFVLVMPDADGGRRLVCNPERAAKRFLPASTFKIANALIGLETGAVRDEREVTPWDGTRRAVPAWNQDTDLASGMRNSTVWFYQAMARRIGAAPMRQWVGRLGYGNGDIGPDDAIAHFWLNGALRISADEEIAFLDRLRRHALPISERSQSTVIRILERDRGSEGDAAWVLRGKTGAALPIDPQTGDVVQGERSAEVLNGAEPVGWFVGWVERDAAHGGDAVFAFNMALRSEADMPLREQLARELLVDNGVLPRKAP